MSSTTPSHPNRRHILRAGLGAIAAVPGIATAAKGSSSSGDSPLPNLSNCTTVIDNAAIPRWVDPLPVPRWIAPLSTGTPPTIFNPDLGKVKHGIAPEWFNAPADWNTNQTQFYQVAMKPGRQMLLPSSMNLHTDFWGYAARQTTGFLPASAPGPLFRVKVGTPHVVRFNNELPEEMSVHLHGGHTPAHSDGYPSFFVLPNEARDYFYPNIVPKENGQFDYTESPSTMWYHDHAQDMTAVHVARGLSGFCLIYDDLELGLIRNGVLPGIRGVSDVGPEFANPYDIPIVIQDRLFNRDGSVCYESNDHNGYLGNVVLCNAKAYPRMTVERRKYRFRFLAGGNSRVWRLRMSDNSSFLRIGKDSWLFPEPQETQAVMLSPANRADIIIDFSKYRPGDSIYLENILAQDDPRGPGVDLPEANATTVRTNPAFKHKFLRFDIVERDARYPDASVALGTSIRPNRPIEASEVVAKRTFEFERKNGQWAINGKFFDERVANATPTLGTVEEWTLTNKGGGWWHPIHIHLEAHQQVKDLRTGAAIPFHDSFKSDTLTLGPNSSFTMRMKFRTFTGPFVFHCHNVEHEDLEMMFGFDPRVTPTRAPQPVQAYFP